MIRHTITLDCGLPQLMRAREALGGTRGVLSARVVTGQSAIRVLQGDEVPDAALLEALSGCGLPVGSIHIR